MDVSIEGDQVGLQVRRGAAELTLLKLSCKYFWAFACSGDGTLGVDYVL